MGLIKFGRNARCPCGSGKKYKKCCLAKNERKRRRIKELSPEFYMDHYLLGGQMIFTIDFYFRI